MPMFSLKKQACCHHLRKIIIAITLRIDHVDIRWLIEKREINYTLMKIRICNQQTFKNCPEELDYESVILYLHDKCIVPLSYAQPKINLILSWFVNLSPLLFCIKKCQNQRSSYWYGNSLYFFTELW